ncbi:MAG TPA: aspartate/glutamate racemase family protein [Chloroflexota bacterium]|nr:aspartate/glutamate racemase family protein [Chloroflexota bacterium]
MRIMFLNQSPRNPRGDAVHERTQALLRGYASPGTELDLCYPDEFEGARVMRAMGAQSVLTGLHHAMATAALIRKTVWAQDSGYDAVIQSNTFDPGVEAGRLAVRIPVIGILRTALHVATNLADKVGITVPLAGHVPYTWRIIRSYGMQDFVTDIRPVEMYGEDMDARKDQLFRAAVDTMTALVAETNPQCIIPLGGALIPYVVSPSDLQREVGIPVLNTKAIAIGFAEMCVRNGMSHSPVTYPSAPLRSEDFAAHAYD